MRRRQKNDELIKSGNDQKIDEISSEGEGKCDGKDLWKGKFCAWSEREKK